MRTLIVLALAMGFALSRAAQAEPIIQDGQKLAFLGDSITQQGAQNPSGYVRLTIDGLATNGIKVTPVTAGISGHKSNDMLTRLEKDVLSKKPAVMTLSCGVNDVWHGSRGVPLESYKQNITAILDQAAAAGVTVVVLTATMIGEDASNENNQKLAPYNDFLRETATARKLPLADLNADMQAALLKAREARAARTSRDNFLTSDGVHMAPPGDLMMAEGVLRALGLDATQLAKARAAWTAPDGPKVRMTVGIPLGTYLRIQEAAAKAGEPTDQYVASRAAAALETPPVAR